MSIVKNQIKYTKITDDESTWPEPLRYFNVIGLGHDDKPYVLDLILIRGIARDSQYFQEVNEPDRTCELKSLKGLYWRYHSEEQCIEKECFDKVTERWK